MNFHAALAHFPKITYNRYKRLRHFFSNMEEVWLAELGELAQAGLEEGVASEFIAWREANPASVIIENLLKAGIRTVSLGEPSYPRLLAEIADPPHTLFFRGTLPQAEQPPIAVVGTRRCSMYGRQVTEELAGDLAKEGVCVVSGLALGVDGYAHGATLDAKGTTVAVLGSGVDASSIFPSAHRFLAERILAEGGAIVSEYPPGFAPTLYSYPARNRIIAGLTLGTLVTEAPAESGALITAKCALDYNREVFAVPHTITSLLGAGGNNLIRQGAALVTTAADILEILQLQHIQETIHNNQILPANPTEATLFAHLTREPQHIDLLIKHSNLPSAVVNSTLVMMEMKGTVKHVGGMLYTLR